ncbi:MAG: glycosyl hydrolase, partial [Tepidisphaeraceae bacterium]
LRQTARELVHDEHLVPLRDFAHANGLNFSVEGYDMNPAGDLMVLGTGDIQMGEFWSQGFGFKTEFSTIEATSAAHTKGQPIVAAESFTASGEDKWQQYPASMKRQGDWALAAGVNKFVFHRYQHQPDLDAYPGQRMGKYGVFWERTQTWWDMVPAYHEYLARASALLRQGTPVADVLYLAPEGAPHVFRPPASATVEQGGLPDRRGYNFDGIDPDRLMEANVENGRVALPGAGSYGVLVLPRYDTMTLPLLRKIQSLLEAGATVIGPRPLRTPGLGTQGDDAALAKLSGELWKEIPAAGKTVGRGLLVNDPTVRPETPAPDPLGSAKWIRDADASVGPHTFSTTLIVPALDSVRSAEVILRATGSFNASVNGQHAGEGKGLSKSARFDATRLLKEGENTLAVTADGGRSGGVEICANMVVRYRDGRTLTAPTNANWLSAATATVKEKKVAVLPNPPAGERVTRVVQYPELYMGYDVTAALLASRGLRPDFEADAPLRYCHRHDGDDEIYFLANPSETAVDVNCTFRVSGNAAEWWDPLTGERRRLPQTHEAGGRTSLPLHFEPDGSGFVVFRHVAIALPVIAATNTVVQTAVATLKGPWDVAFDPKWGGPATVRFATLDDWSKRPEPGIRDYSGTATYQTSFGASGAALRANELSLGDVHAMARVRLNGKELGVVWCQPWTVSIPAGLLKPAGNTLEVSVANLWINRLIGDAGLPVNQRLTKTTSNPYRASDERKPSGLRGPVQLMAVK